MLVCLLDSDRVVFHGTRTTRCIVSDLFDVHHDVFGILRFLVNVPPVFLSHVGVVAHHLGGVQLVHHRQSFASFWVLRHFQIEAFTILLSFLAKLLSIGPNISIRNFVRNLLLQKLLRLCQLLLPSWLVVFDVPVLDTGLESLRQGVLSSE